MTLKQIKAIVEHESGIDIATPCRVKEHVLARAIYCLVSRERTRKSLRAIGEEIDRKHDSVLHLINKSKYFVKHEKDYKQLYSDVLSVIDFGLKDSEIPEDKIKVVEKIVYRDFNDNLRQCEKDLLDALKNVSDNNILEFNKTRLQPFLSMLKSKRTHKVKEVAGASRSFTMQC